MKPVSQQKLLFVDDMLPITESKDLPRRVTKYKYGNKHK